MKVTTACYLFAWVFKKRNHNQINASIIREQRLMENVLFVFLFLLPYAVKALIEFSVILLFFLPLYQNMLPNSCGPCNILHVKLMSLPLFTYKSVGPIILAFSSGLQEKSKNEGKFNEEYFLQEGMFLRLNFIAKKEIF